ncbi:membrane-associated protein, putative [Bodo saltans]|uniref:Membrane-associated protein, putative n=1 Tax=Bodo saltans TaxID=75058 RepID=A0A0S4IZ00_BODSA|nr:membrane-associated protein, putative [Bodo saltans]|eukprot:CUG03877.1 membrane-associated protein, putative [Bodo saltans]
MPPTVHYVFQQARWMSGATRELILAMGIGFKWVSMTIRMLIFGALVGPFFLPMILWYILSPNIIRHVAYRTSKTTRDRHLKSLIKKVRHVVTSKKQQQHDPRTTTGPSTPMAGGGATGRGDGGGSVGNTSPLFQGGTSDWTATTAEKLQLLERGQHDSEKTWSRIASSFFRTPQRLKAGIKKSSVDTIASLPSYDYVTDALRSEGTQSADAPATVVPPSVDVPLESCRNSSSSPVPSYSSTNESTDDDDDSDGVDDHEDVKNLHNRAVLDIYLPCPLDELLRVQHRLFEGRNVQDVTPTSSPRKRSGTSEFAQSSKSQHSAASTSSRPTMEVKKYPIVICVSGGAWIIGCHLWGALLARILAGRGCIVFCPDYRNFPQSNMAEMTRDVSDAIAWVLRNAERYNGDLDNVTLIGQSAGAHLSWMSIISQARLAAEAKAKAAMSSSGSDLAPSRSIRVPDMDFGSTVCNFSSPHLLGSTVEGSGFAYRMEESVITGPTSVAPRLEVAPCEALMQLLPVCPNDAQVASGNNSSVYIIPRYNPRRSIHRFIPLSGIYDLPHLIKHFHRRGLYRKVLYRIAGGKERLRNEFCVNRYFEPTVAPTTSTAGPLTVHTNTGIESPLLASVLNREPTSHGIANRPMLPDELRKALLREGCEENAWAVDQLLMNESFIDSTIRRRPPTAPPTAQSPGAKASLLNPPIISTAPMFLDELPQRIVFLHGDNDMSAPISEPLRLYHKMQEALQSRTKAAQEKFPVDLSMVCIEGGTHTNVIVEELLSGGGKRSVVANFVAEELGLPPAPLGHGKGSKKKRTPPLSSSSSSTGTGSSTTTTLLKTQPTVDVKVQNPNDTPYRVIPMEVAPRNYNVFLRMGSYVCPF